ncbi:hypothetical protein O988_02871 [Pseudogymnoascus sp. VKM F-3808]|nr:hypothetical protein O988_02871 [Pseudogymnoascus sp. VKM F-3808]
MASLNQLPDTECLEPGALVTYHFASILLRDSLSDILTAARTIASYGPTLTSQRVQDALPRLESNGCERQSAYHALEILRLCVEDDGTKLAFEIYGATQPLYLTYGAFIAVLVVWAHALSLRIGRVQSRNACEDWPLYLTYGAFIAVLVVWAHALSLRIVRPKESLWAIRDGRLKLVDMSGPGAIEECMRRLGELSKPGIGAEITDGVIVATIGMMKIVQKGLERSVLELSHEAKGVFDVLHSCTILCLKEGRTHSYAPNLVRDPRSKRNS